MVNSHKTIQLSTLIVGHKSGKASDHTKCYVLVSLFFTQYNSKCNSFDIWEKKNVRSKFRMQFALDFSGNSFDLWPG